MSTFFLVWLPIIATIATCGVGILKGDTPERYGATVMFVAWVSGLLVASQRIGPIMTNLLFAIDIVVFLAFCALTYTYRRGWIVVASLAQGLQIVVHIARETGNKINDFTYIYTLAVAGYAILVALIVGTVIAWREREALASFGIVADQPDNSSPASARSIRPSVFSTPKMATKDPNRGPWF